MNATISRYNCQVTLPGFGEAAQQLLQNAKVLIVGAGGLGCPTAQYLAAAGIGTLGIADDDVISIGNLHRQVLYTPSEAGLKKVATACQKLQEQNPGIKLVPHDLRVTDENVMALIQDYDIIADCTDNFAVRYLLNDACVQSGKPLIYGAVYQYEGQVAVWNTKNTDGTYTPNYRDVFPNVNAAQIPNCAEGGVLPTLTGIIGCMQANEIIKIITGIGETLRGKILLLDVQTLQSRIINIGMLSKAIIKNLPATTTIPTISLQEYEKNKETYLLIDVRTPEEHATENIGGINIPLSEIATADISADKPIICYCATGNRSDVAVKIINDKYPSVKVFSLGTIR